MSSLGRKKTLDQDAVDEILSFASNFEDCAPDDDAIDLLLDFLQTQPRKDKETVHRLVTKLSRADTAIYDGDDDGVTRTSEPDWHIIDTFKVPKFRYDPIKKSFYKHAGRLPIHGEASAKSALYKDRFLLLSQIISRHKEFSRPAFGSKSSDSGSREISPIQSLIGQTGRRWVMGLISQLEDGPDDAGPSTALPRNALPKYLTEELQNHIPNCIFSSNPCSCCYHSPSISYTSSGRHNSI
ncbi:hypothetical protein DVH24_023449 [Malus domestica]|uniref:Uncharacterized protein n=1 Tax=Malus domestica TaxID=3750 RepID=A0A498I510_MALDO|nr:hypothetical protein DVH24_023449 [Malus domestica]